jgi:hypothetical protein
MPEIPDPSDLATVCARNNRRRRCRTAEQGGYEFSPPDVDCHKTFQTGKAGMLPRFDRRGRHAQAAKI